MTIRRSCFICGAVLADIPAVLLPGSGQALQCPACLDHQIRERDLVLGRAPLQILAAPLGRIVIRRAAVRALAEAGQAALEFLARHAGCSCEKVPCACGGLPADDDGRAVSEHWTARGQTLRVVTEHWADGPVTTIGLLKED